ncbi:ABC transporter permease [Bacillus sp. LL01]|uniref:ABC transporter permease subunit n=1 Tax=Bacillus sp. LL01 TaxID=1665556 RepID=UPI0018E36DCB|nr:ABC transporter permease [Bacillus sp. LL01]
MALVFTILLIFFPRGGYYGEIPVELGDGGFPGFQLSLFLDIYKNNIIQFFQHIWEHKSLGGTMFSETSVEKELFRYYPKSLLVIVIGFVVSIIAGVYKGIFDYRNTYTKKNLLGNGTTWLFQSIPDFFIVIIAFYLAFYYLPMGLIFSNQNWYSFAAPALLVSIYPTMYVARMTCVSLLNQDGQDYIRTAFAKGFKVKQVINRHILRNSALDLIAHLPTIMMVVISNMLMVEYLTGYAGAGNRMFVALGGRQNTVGFGATTIEAGLVFGFALCFIATVLVVHVLKMLLLTKLSQKGA